MFPAIDILDRISTLAIELKLANLQPQIAACRNQGLNWRIAGRMAF